MDDEITMRRPALSPSGKPMTGEDLEPEPTEQDLAMKELLLPNEYEFPWLTAIRKTSLETLFFNRYTAVSRWGEPRADSGT